MTRAGSSQQIACTQQLCVSHLVSLGFNILSSSSLQLRLDWLPWEILSFRVSRRRASIYFPSFQTSCWPRKHCYQLACLLLVETCNRHSECTWNVQYKFASFLKLHCALQQRRLLHRNLGLQVCESPGSWTQERSRLHRKCYIAASKAEMRSTIRKCSSAWLSIYNPPTTNWQLFCDADIHELFS